MREFKEQIEIIDSDLEELRNAKELVRRNKKPLHKLRLDSKTIVVTTREENIERYKNHKSSFN